jgi:hypothetical protein
MEASSTA